MRSSEQPGAMLLMQAPWPAAAKLRAAPLSAWLGGVFGAAYAIVTVILVRQTGAATLIALVVAGQLICSVWSTTSACSGSRLARRRSGVPPAAA